MYEYIIWDSALYFFIVDDKLAKQLYHALILPLFEYCDSVYGNCNITQLIRL